MKLYVKKMELLWFNPERKCKKRLVFFFDSWLLQDIWTWDFRLTTQTHNYNKKRNVCLHLFSARCFQDSLFNVCLCTIRFFRNFWWGNCWGRNFQVLKWRNLPEKCPLDQTLFIIMTYQQNHNKLVQRTFFWYTSMVVYYWWGWFCRPFFSIYFSYLWG